jgi:glutaredoxin
MWDTASGDSTFQRAFRSYMTGACLLSVIGSMWAVLVPPGCDSCQKAAELMRGVNLGALGVLFYGHLLVVLTWKGPTRYVFCCTALAAGIHTVLIALLIHRQLVCPPCLLTTAGAFTMLGLSLAIDRRNFRRAAIILPVAMVVAVGGRMLLYRIVPSPDVIRQRQIQIALQREEREPPVPVGRVRLLVYARPGCHYCKELDERVMPAIRHEFGSSLQIDYRPAWKKLITPTLVIRGERRTHFAGLPTLDALRKAIHFAQGKGVTRLPAGRWSSRRRLPRPEPG